MYIYIVYLFIIILIMSIFYKKYFLFFSNIIIFFIITIIIFYFYHNKFYRLGDIIYYRNNFLFSNLMYNTYKLFPNSIASKYIKYTNKKNDYNILFRILKIHDYEFKEQIPENTKNVLVLHLRTGDVIDDSKYTVDELLKDEKKTFVILSYVKPFSYFEELYYNINKNNKYITDIHIISGSHVGKLSEKSLEYINKIEIYLTSKLFNVTKYLDLTPDDSFLYMSKSYYFKPTSGGFSRVASEMVKMYGNIIL